MPENLLSGLTEHQRQAVLHLDGPMLVLAGPGSGKTRVITHRVARLIEQGLDPRRILALTFTNKAAEEMRVRLQALKVPEGSLICTFHSLCVRLLREFAVRAGLPAASPTVTPQAPPGFRSSCCSAKTAVKRASRHARLS